MVGSPATVFFGFILTTYISVYFLVWIFFVGSENQITFELWGFLKKLSFKVCHPEELTLLVCSFINLNVHLYSVVAVRIQNRPITLYTPSHYPLVMGRVGFIGIIPAL